MYEATASLREKRREKRRREILQAALEVFGEKGYPKTTMDEIAERALLTRPALYKYFSDKQSILKGLTEWKLKELIAIFQEIVGGAGSFTEKLSLLVDEAVRFQKQNRGVFRAVMTANSLPSLARDENFRELEKELEGVITRLIKEGIDAAEVRNLPPAELAGLLLTLLFNPAVTDFMAEEGRDPYDGELMKELFLRGVSR